MAGQKLVITEYGAIEGRDCTTAIQKVIDQASAGDMVVVPKGIFLTGSLFLKNNMELHLEKGAVLMALQEEEAFPMIWTRVAGVEMEWPAAVINALGKDHVKITGEGCIDGHGEHWWRKYWGEDRMGGMRKEYDSQGLRWAVDYDCTRVRNVLIMNGTDIVIQGITSKRSGFWNIHLCYCRNVHVDGVHICENRGPSTDGIDIDSSSEVVVENCDISCSDDNICMKAGRDADGLRVNRVCENVTVRNCVLREGSGITLGSETSGGIRNIFVDHISFYGTGCGFRIKSASTRGGILEHIRVSHLKMINVHTCFPFQLQWNPSYSLCEIPKEYDGVIPERWRILTQAVPEKKGIPFVHDVKISHVTADFTEDYPKEGKSVAFDLQGYPESPITDVYLEDIRIRARKFGNMEHVTGLICKNMEITVES